MPTALFRRGHFGYYACAPNRSACWVGDQTKKEVATKNAVLWVKTEARKALIEKRKERFSLTQKRESIHTLISDLE